MVEEITILIILSIIIPSLILLLCMIDLVDNLYMYLTETPINYTQMYTSDDFSANSASLMWDDQAEQSIIFVSGWYHDMYGGITASDSENVYDTEYRVVRK